MLGSATRPGRDHFRHFGGAFGDTVISGFNAAQDKLMLAGVTTGTLAATRALANLAKEDVPDSVCRAYGVLLVASLVTAWPGRTSLRPT